MILSPIPTREVPRVIAAVARHLPPPEAAVLRRIAGSGAERARRAPAERHRCAALALARHLGMGTLAGSPSRGFGWDGARLRAGTEAYVLLHEVAHFQLAPPRRRRLVDFGLGAGPETGLRSAADRTQRAFGATRETEEAMASLLGILWEAELGHPALASFLDQNWLEGGPEAAGRHFTRTLARLRRGGFVDSRARPTARLRRTEAPVGA